MSKIEEEKTVLELNAGILVERESGSTSPHRRNHGVQNVSSKRYYPIVSPIPTLLFSSEILLCFRKYDQVGSVFGNHIFSENMPWEAPFVKVRKGASSAQCAFCQVRWPCGQKLKSKNTLSDGKKYF